MDTAPTIRRLSQPGNDLSPPAANQTHAISGGRLPDLHPATAAGQQTAVDRECVARDPGCIN